jgi:hypothetical protein
LLDPCHHHHEDICSIQLVVGYPKHPSLNLNDNLFPRTTALKPKEQREEGSCFEAERFLVWDASILVCFLN